MKLSRTSLTSLGFASLSLLALAGCPVTADALCDQGTCDALPPDATTPDVGAPDAGEDAIVVLPRDPCVDKPLAPECVTNDGALFVSSAANPAVADGTIEHPYPTIGAAVSNVTGEKRRIYVCEGTYGEQVSLESAPMTLIGGVGCDFRTKGAKAKIVPPSGTGLAVASVGGTSVIDIAVEAASIPNAKGSSAIAMFVTRSKNILLRGVEAKAGDAQPGADGADAIATPNWEGAQPFANNTATGAGAAPPACVKCKDGTSSSFAGGGGSTTGGFPEAGTATPPVGSTNGGGNGTPCSPGTDGANGDAPPAAAGAARPGALLTNGFDSVLTAEQGPVGNPGQGGGGGGANTSTGGGSGGCGGCGGGGGGAGGNGGSSIALLVFESEVIIEDSTLTAGVGGKGGRGGKGQEGQLRAGGGSGACVGGQGGFGAGGGGGGGGAGGYSLAIGHVGSPPKIERSSLVKSTGGPVGAGGDPGTAANPAGKTGNPGGNGAAGEAAETLDIE
jgi:hypothetical protein